jgi:predicted neutral ceramidase superfamily lipid hydrolase
MSVQGKYFLIAVVFIGSAGIWLPAIIEWLVYKKITFHNIPQNVITYFVSLLFAGSIDYFLNRIRKIDIYGVADEFLNLAGLIILGAILVVGGIVINLHNYDFISLLIGSIGIALSYRIWWIANKDNPNFASDAALGGDPSKKIRNK